MPEHRYGQAEITDAIAAWPGVDEPLLRHLHTATQVEGRNLALPLADYAKLDTFTQANDAYREIALDLAERAVVEVLRTTGTAPAEIDQLVLCSSTGLATPSLDATLAQRTGLRADVRRLPIFGLGCAAGASGLARLHDYLAGRPDDTALLVCVELCSLTVQRDDVSVANLVAGGLFGDGAAAVVATGRPGGAAPEVLATRSHLYPDTQHLMGWHVGEYGFRIVLSPDLTGFVAEHVPGDLRAFLAEHGLTPGDVGTWICHPGGPKIIDALAESLDLPAEALAVSRRSLREHGNLSSVSVLHVLRETTGRPGEPAVLMALGPGFSSELLLLRW
ncbi:type III polyketide synthase [Nonomuraea sp. NBC_01738]|uniref:type III polyketide synthase n=1 Tax=Nonomuraea sp. NBC_01738 TaxID=2976003 RepID=UPI002E108127|nr:type III polyketide synthase [Nonomuraea sp. NBC_01738]